MPHPRFGARSMAMDGLQVFVAVPAADYAACCFAGEVPRRCVGGHAYIGLRERAEDALERACHWTDKPVNKDTHLLLRVHFTAHGVAHYCTGTSSAEHSFSPVLTKKLFWKDPTDWKVWHFHGDLPLGLSGPGDIAYVTTEWMQIM